MAGDVLIQATLAGLAHCDNGTALATFEGRLSGTQIEVALTLRAVAFQAPADQDRFDRLPKERRGTVLGVDCFFRLADDGEETDQHPHLYQTSVIHNN